MTFKTMALIPHENRRITVIAWTCIFEAAVSKAKGSS